MNEKITIQEILDALSQGDEERKKTIQFLFFNVGAMQHGVNLICLAINHGMDALRESGVTMKE